MRFYHHTTIDTSGYIDTKKIEKVLDFTDLFLYDLKHLDNTKHVNYTGVSNELILKNLAYLIKQKKQVIIRIPVIPGVNNQDKYERKN